MKKAVASTLWNNLKAYYTGDSTPNDALGVYNGTLTNGATYTTGKINNGFSLDGVNDYVSISPTFGASFSSPTSAHSYSAWVNIPSAQTGFIIQNGNGGMGTSMVVSSNWLGVYYRGGNSLIQTTNTISYNTWTHCVATYNGAGTFKLYLNGTLRDTFTGRSWTDGAGTCTTQIGSYNGTGLYFKGTTDEVCAFTKELSATEITELYNSGSGKQYPL